MIEFFGSVLTKFQSNCFDNYSPQNLKEVLGEGMPITGTRNKGNLYVKFNIIFPRVLTE